MNSFNKSSDKLFAAFRNTSLAIAVAVFTFGINCFAFGDAEGEIKRLDESVLDAPPVEAVLVVPEDRVFPKKYVEAGYFPSYVGDEIINGYPVVLTFSEKDRKKALNVESEQGYGRLLNRFLGVSTWFGFLKGKPLALIVDDLKVARLNPKKFWDVNTGIHSLLHIKLETPGHQATFPKQATLYIKLLDHDIHIHNEDIVVETALSLTAQSNGDYYLSDPIKARAILKELETTAHDVVGITYWQKDAKGRELKLSKITGINDNTQVKNVPRMKGVVMTHKIYVGTTLFESGWQWFGRTEGLFQARQEGFIQ